MDENYLDNLLNEISLDSELDHKIEDELDSQLADEKQKKQEADLPSKDEAFDLGLDLDILDSEEPLDFDFSEDQIDELDKLDNLADLDIGDLDFSDIDFDDVDITKLDGIQDDDFDDLLKDFEGDLEIDSFFDSGEKDQSKEDVVADTEEAVFDEPQPVDIETEEQPEETHKEPAEEMIENNDDLNEDSFDANDFLDSLLEEAEEAEVNQNSPIEELPEDFAASSDESEETDKGDVDDDDEPVESLEDLLAEHEGLAGLDLEEAGSKESDLEEVDSAKVDSDEDNKAIGDDFEQLAGNSGVLEQDDLDDLLSMLDMQEKEGALSDISEADDISGGDLDISQLGDVEASSEEASKKTKEKKSISQILFGDPDEEDELSEEELAAIEAKKAAKKEKKQAAKEEKAQKKEEKKAQKAVSDDSKKKESEEKKRVKAEKKAKLKAEAAAEAALEKKLNKPMVFFVFTIFLGGVLIFYVFTNDFNYKVAIEKAANYFASQKYHKAYDEIKGVEVKEPDKELKDRIYTVMYVERLYEAYETNLSMNREEKALDSLLRGVTKYYEHYDEAKELDIVSDIDYSFSQIQEALISRYGITIEQAVEINKLDSWQYVQVIGDYTKGLAPVVNDDLQQDSQASSESEEADVNESEDAILPDEEEQ